jgi:signal transduction histidine kinase
MAELSVHRPAAARASILAVDDTPANLFALEALIKPLGHELITATSGTEALELARRHEFAVVLLDVMMPGLDGYQTLELLRAIPLARNTPVILLTAGSLAPNALERAYALGAIDYIEKPIAPAVLRGKLNAFVSLFLQGQEIRRQAEALRAKDRHIGVLAHDVRTPLGVIAMAAARLEEQGDTPVQAMAMRISRAVKRIQSLTDDLLECARMAAGQVEIKRCAVDLRDVLNEILDDFEATHPAVHFSRDLPATVRGTWDRTRVQQALSNLLTNAVKYGDGWVELKVTQTDRQVRIVIENSCAELSEAQLEGLFAPFTQGNERRAGVGLGLHIVREIARAHGGDAYGHWADGRITFTVELGCDEVDALLTDGMISAAREDPIVTDTLVRATNANKRKANST